MERVVRRNEVGDIACDDIIIYSDNYNKIGKNTKETIYTNWKIIKPKYYRYKDDDCLIEVWYYGKGIILDNGLNKFLEIGYISNSWSDEKREEISYKQAMEILRMKQNKGYNNKDLMSRRVIKNGEPMGWEKLGYQLDITKIIKDFKGNICCEIEAPTVKQNNNGGATDYYTLPEDANTLQDLIEYRNMNGSVKDIFKACYRLGIKTEDELRDLNKMAYYSLREIGRITGRKDYITIAKELMGEQAIEKDEKIFKGLK